MRLWIWLLIIMLPSLGACHCEQGRDGKCRDAQSPSNSPLTAKWQLFDADTEKPIEGAWINFLWYGKADSTGHMPCVRGVLGRTNADGKFQDTAKDGSWRLAGQPPMLFVPGYERLVFRQDDPEQNRVTAYVAVQHYERDAYPAWEQRLRDMGYVAVGAEVPNGTVRYEKAYSTKLIKSSMNRAAVEDGGRTELWVTRRSLPIHGSAPGIGAKCTNPNAENIGFANGTDKQLDRERALHAFTYLCDPQWDSVPADFVRTPSRTFVHQSLWLLDDPEHAEDLAREVIPDYYAQPKDQPYALPKSPDSEDRALRPDERATFCKWLAPYSNQAASKEL